MARGEIEEVTRYVQLFRFQFVVVMPLVMFSIGCASTGVFQSGELAAIEGDWDSAVEFYRRAVQEDPDNPEYRIGLERAMQRASAVHLGRAQELEAQDQLQAALIEYRRASEYDPVNGQLIAIVSELERRVRAMA